MDSMITQLMQLATNCMESEDLDHILEDINAHKKIFGQMMWHAMGMKTKFGIVLIHNYLNIIVIGDPNVYRFIAKTKDHNLQLLMYCTMQKQVLFQLTKTEKLDLYVMMGLMNKMHKFFVDKCIEILMSLLSLRDTLALTKIFGQMMFLAQVMRIE